MRVRTISLALVTVAAAFGRVLTAAPPTSQAAAELSGVVQVPAGMRLVAGRGGGGGRGGSRLVFADGEARPLYVSSNAAVCTGSCLERWQPALAPTGATALGEWAPVAVGTAGRRWAYRGKPAYVSTAPVTAPPAAAGRGAGRGGAGGGGAGRGAADGVSQAADGMAVVVADPSASMQFPHGISSFEYRMAPGLLLAVGVGVATPGGKALYAFVGTPAEESKLSSVFRPRYASALDRHVGEFTVRQRSDGTPQWAFRGAPLYTCDCDVEAGDVNGKGIIGIVPALLLRYPMPPEVGLRRHQIAGGHLVEAATNQTLYYRDRVQDHFNPDNRRPLEGPVDPGIGAILGTKHCDAQCEREWRPLLARQDALPLGFWSFYARADGTRQWAYKDTAVYTHVGEPPGTLYGNETYEIRYNDGLTNPRPPVEFGMGLLWRALVP